MAESLTVALVRRWAGQVKTLDDFSMTCPNANLKSQDYFIKSRSLNLIGATQEISDGLLRAGLEFACGRFYSIAEGVPVTDETAALMLGGHEVALSGGLKGLREFSV